VQEEEVRIVAPLILAELSLELSKEEEGAEQNPPIYDMERYREMIPDAVETVLGIFGFDRTVYSSSNFNNKKNKAQRTKNKWYEELGEEE
jgi:hypothetical protein